MHTAQLLAAGLLTWLSLVLSTSHVSSDETRSLRVMTFNLWEGGDGGKQTLDQSVKVITAVEADVVGMQETTGQARGGAHPDNGRAIADKLSWHYVDQDDGVGLISRYKIRRSTPSKLGALIELRGGRHVWVFNVHLMHKPYQPYQLLKIPYGDAPFIETSEEAVREARAVHGKAVAALLQEIEVIRKENTAIFITGDFNEPSALDWTNAVYQAKRCPAAVPWPSSAALLDAGFVDAYREKHPDPLSAPGYTWTPITAEDDPADRHDRIDFILVGGTHGPVREVKVVGESKARADVVIEPYPSDHRAVVAEVELE